MKTLALLAIIFLGFAAQFGLSRFLETNRIVLPPEIAEEDLSLRAETVKRLSFGFDGLVADYYWTSALQYIGRKIVNHEGEIQIDDLKPLDPRLLYPLLDAATTLDPQFAAAYSYGSTVLPAVNLEQAVKISEKGIAAQPDNWRMYYNLGYIHWRSENYAKAAEIYNAGADKPGAPGWMRQLVAKMNSEGGSRDTARAIYLQMYETASDEQTRQLATRRLAQVQSLDERDSIRLTLGEYERKNNRCPQSWREIFPLLKTKKMPDGTGFAFSSDAAPLDPLGAPYLLLAKNGKCDVDLDWRTSQVPYQ